MPNWVFNTLGNWDKDLYNKYKGEGDDPEDVLELDFNKVIPEPEEITNTISGSINTDAKQVVEYRDWKNENKYNLSKYSSPLYRPLQNKAETHATTIGYSAIENPSKSLNQMIVEDTTNRIKGAYESYTSVFGNVGFNKLSNEQFIESCENHCNNLETRFKRSKESEYNKNVLDKYENIEAYGRHLKKLKETYGVDNWYDWRNINWGTKWNGCNQNYDPETESLNFDTVWSVPEPIFAKIAEDNPDKNIDIYSEEETGWFVESECKDGNYYQTATGEIEWNEEADESITNREELNPPKLIGYKESVEANTRFTNDIKNTLSNL